MGNDLGPRSPTHTKAYHGITFSCIWVRHRPMTTPGHRRVCLSLLDDSHDTAAARQRQPVPPSPIGSLPECRPPKDRRRSSPHPTWTDRPGTAADPLRHNPAVGRAIVRLLDSDRSTRLGPLRTGVAVALRNTLPEFLATAAKTSILVQFIRNQLDLSSIEGTSLAA